MFIFNLYANYFLYLTDLPGFKDPKKYYITILESVKMNVVLKTILKSSFIYINQIIMFSMGLKISQLENFQYF